jgi:hypothetical protein
MLPKRSGMRRQQEREGWATMGPDRAARMAVVIWARLLASACRLAAGSAARGRLWRVCFRVVAVGAAAALLTAGLAAAPADAAPVARAGGAISIPGLGGPAGAGTAKGLAKMTPAVTVLPAQLELSFDFQSYDPAETSAAINYWWPGSLGLPSFSSLADLLYNTWLSWQDQNPPSEWLPPEPTDLSGASISITSDGGTGSILTLTVPTPSGGTVTSTGIPPVVVDVLSQLIGAIAAVGSLIVCGAYLYGLPSNDSGWAPEFSNARLWAQATCGAITNSVWTQFATITADALAGDETPTLGFPWKDLLTLSGTALVFAYGFPYAAPFIKALQYAWLGLAIWVGAINSGGSTTDKLISLLSPYLSPDALDNVNAIVDTFTYAQLQQFTNGGPAAVATLFGFWTPEASGYVGNVPTGAAVTVGSGDCMDAYGSNGDNEPAAPPAVPGQSVAINVCNGNPAQVFTFWPNGQIENWGLCMDDNGDTDPADTPVVNLQVCNGGYTQLWYENSAGEIVNAATGNCLDDPGGNTTPGTQLIAYPCNGGANQLWAPPNGTSAVTGFGPILSVQHSGSTQYCMMPQTTLSNPVGSNIITSTGGNCSSSNLVRMWAVGANGTLMANGTNALCMDSDGPATTGPGGEAAYFVQLQGCDGSASQVWNVVSTHLGPTLQNAGDGLCINTPSGQLGGPVVSMVVASCASLPSAGELWTLPGFSAPRSLLSGGPCDIYLYYGTACVAAYSMTRAMYSDYDGPLYQVQRASDGTTANIGLLAAGGDVNASEQDSFCAGTTCTITEIYDQSPEGNNLTIEGPGGNPVADQGAVANALPVTIGGNEAYGLDIEPGTGYRDDSTTGVATGGGPESMYMVASGTHVNAGCCFDFGNAETSNTDNGAGHMDAVNLTTWCGNNSQPCTGSGPWVEADMENGQWMGNGPNPSDTGNSSNFVTAVLKNDGQANFELEGGDSQSGGLTTWYDGPLPSGYSPMDQEGAIVLGTGGDNSNADVGSFFEGVMTDGFPSDAADAAVQANIVAAGYGGSSNPTPGDGVTPSAAGQAVVHSAGATGAAASGYSSVYTVDSANGHLQETYLPYMGDSWTTQDLSANYGTPPVMPGTQPVALVHCGYTSVYTVDASSGDLQETYLSSIGNGWATQDLSANYGTPPTDETPTAVVHSAGAVGATAGCGYTSVYTVDRNGDLQETYLPNTGFPGDSWHTQDLSANYHTPQIQPGTSPVAIVHCGYTSVYSVDAGSHDLQETYLPAIGDAWSSQDLSANYGTPPTDTTPTAVVHSAGAAGASAGCGYTSVYTVDQGSRHLQETYLPNAGFPGDPWHTQDLSANYGTPAVAPGTAPVALVHMGYTSVYTVDQGSDQVQETYLANIGAPWATQSLSANYGTPTTDQTPIVLLHPDASGNLDWASVYTVDEFSNDLQETYLSNVGFPGDPWVTQDLSANYHTPPAYVLQSSQAGWTLAHTGYTSAFTIDAGDSSHTAGDLQETYLSGIGAPWATHDLSAMAGTPAVSYYSTPISLVHDGYTSVFTVDNGNGTGINTGDSGDITDHLQETYLSGIGAPWATHDLSAMAGTPPVALGSSPTAVFHDGYTSVYTIDANSLHLQETYLSGIGAPWVTQDLNTVAGTPPVMLGTSPVAVFHDGYTSVYTIDAGDATHAAGDLQETFLPVMGGPWYSQDLSAEFHTPTTEDSPTVVFHDGFTSVYTIDANGDLQETYLPAIGDPWTTQDLTGIYHLPSAQNFAPVALYHTGYTSVYYIPSGGGLEEAYLPAIGGPWQFQNLSTNYQMPATNQPPSPLVHYAPNGGLTWTSLFTIDAASPAAGHLQETYLPAIGDPWTTQDLTAMTSGPDADACVLVSCP